MEEINSFRPLRPGNSTDLDRFADMLDVAVVSLREAGKVEELGDGCVYAMLLQKMTEPMIASFHRWVFEYQRQESVETLRVWVLQEAEFQTIASEVKFGVADKSNSANKKVRPKSCAFFGTHHIEAKVSKCILCHKDSHEMRNCKQFKTLDVDKRWEKAKELQLCFRCLGTDHTGKHCHLFLKCGIDGCSASHNKLLHSSPGRSVDRGIDTIRSSNTPLNDMPQTITMSTATRQSHFSALRTIPVVLKQGTRRITVNALLDVASTHTYINDDVASELGVYGKAKSIAVSVLNSKTEIFSSKSVEFGLESLDGTVDIRMKAFTVPKVTGNMQVIDWKKHKAKWQHLQHIEFPTVTSRPIVDILIGMDYLELHCSRQEIAGRIGEPVARLTPLGWTCVGNVGGIDENGLPLVHAFFTQKGDSEVKHVSELEQLMHAFWEVENIPEKNCLISAEEQVAVDAVTESLEHTGERYKVGIPWKETVDELEVNYDMAVSRLLSIEKKLSKDENISAAYEEGISQYLKKGYIRKVSDKEVCDSKWYLPHFPVVKPDKVTSKVRMVFDASAKNRDRSLNDVIHQGPKLQNDLFEILLRFRRHPIAVICDIAEMYLQIEISEKDRAYFRFLWRSMDQSRKPDVYEFSRVVFGINCSHFLAQYISQEHARSCQSSLPLAAETVCKSTYMDDNMDSLENDEKAVHLYEELMELWSSARMHARKWMSNSWQVLDKIYVADRLTEIDIQMNELPSVKTLGLSWNAERDEFNFIYNVQDQGFKMTKRNLLRETAKLFDPLGLIAPFSVRAKILLQEVWLYGSGWDDMLNPELEQKAWQWYQEVEHLGSFTVPRCMYLSLSNEGGTLHVFADASQDAYGGVIYSVSPDKSTHIVASKSHVAPIKAVSIPRMELLAAVLGVKLAIAVTKSLEVTLENVVFWVDSQNVLWWIKRQSRTFKTFVVNRIGYIQENTKPNQWKYVPSCQNPADILTRGITVETLKNGPWLHGPAFLSSNESEWPVQNINYGENDKREMKRPDSKIGVTMTTQIETDASWRLEPTRFSDWKRLCRVYAWVYRFLNNSSAPYNLREQGELEVYEVVDAETKLIAKAQKESFPDEYISMVKNKQCQLPKCSKLLGLRPLLDDSGLMRLRGRLAYADMLSSDTRCPIILPRQNWLTMLIVKHYHEKGGHSGTNSTLSAISSRFWIISAREAIREWERQCTWCQRQKAKPTQQVMSDLPKMRVKYSLRAFEQTGVDFAGPFLTVQGRGKSRQKRYLCLFTCLATRAVHLEMAFGLDSDSFLNAFFRMANRRGMPKEMLSDNETNFVGAAKELKELVTRNVDSDQVERTLASKGVKWNFNPPHSPHFGGVFESLIKSAKRAIFAILSAGDISDELMTVFTGAEALLNSRPLTYQSAHPDDPVSLKRNHFLYGQVGGDFAPEIDASHNPQKR